ncbi:MAG TPA: adenylate/guanylate cyclase domain-containing protein [Anaerolineae bacterium]|nr:adenylate/guanylate cyclase domain-containing protein [Anaerolineae bacterium]
MSTHEQLTQAIATLENQRAILGDTAVNAAIAGIQAQLDTLPQPATTDPQRKQVTILFTDIANFTALSETMDPEDVSHTMNTLWHHLDTIIHNHNGYIDKHMGDSVMAFWGAQQAHEEDPEQAVRAALAMHQAVTDHAWTDDPNLPTIQLRTGIHTGPVLLGAVGTTGEYTAMGDTVNIASRLEHQAPINGILISHDTYRHTRGIFEVQAQPPLTVKGKTDPLQTYFVRQLKPRAFRTGTRGVEGVETRMIGRDQELAQLTNAFNQTQQTKTAHFLTIVGDAGIGKSRLIYEFRNWLELHPIHLRLFKGRADHQRQNLPYALLRDIFSFRFQIAESDSAATARPKFEQGIAQFLGPNSHEKAHFIGQLLGFDFSHSPALQGVLDDTAQIRDRAIHYLIQFFEAVSNDQPTTILLEDVHWADDASLQLITHLYQQLTHAPILILAVTRPDFFERYPDWMPTATHITLNPLPQTADRELAEEILQKLDLIPPLLLEAITQRAEGNPFYIEEMIKMLIDDGIILTGETKWQVNPHKLIDLRLPSTLTGILQARLDKLSQTEKLTLQRASVIGRVFWDTAVEHLAHQDPHHPDVLFDPLQTKELIFPRDDSAFFGTQEFLFKHALLRDVTYESVLKRARQEYHHQAATWMVAMAEANNRSNEYAGVIGQHFEEANQADKASIWYERAGDQAFKSTSFLVARDYYQKALSQTSDPEQTRRLHVSIMSAANNTGDQDIAIKHGQIAYDLSHAAKDLINQSQALRGLAFTYHIRNQHKKALSLAQQATQLFITSPPTTDDHLQEQINALRTLAWLHFQLGQSPKTLGYAQQMLDLSYKLENDTEITRSLNMIGITYGLIGQQNKAAEYYHRALKLAHEIGDRQVEATLLGNLGERARKSGDFADALNFYQKSREIFLSIGGWYGAQLEGSNIGAALVSLGRYQDAIHELNQIMDNAIVHWHGFAESNRFKAEAYLGLNDIDNAIQATHQSYKFAYNANSPDYIGHAWRLFGNIASITNQPITIVPDDPVRYDADNCYQKSLTIFQDAQMAWDEAITLWDWARHQLKQGESEQAHQNAQLARSILTELEFSHLVDQLNAEFSHLSVG